MVSDDSQWKRKGSEPSELSSEWAKQKIFERTSAGNVLKNKSCAMPSVAVVISVVVMKQW